MVYLLLAPGFEESEAVVPADLLRQAEIETALVSLSGPTVTGAHNITIQADLELSQVDLDQAEMIVLPGGGVGVENLWNRPPPTPPGTSSWARPRCCPRPVPWPTASSSPDTPAAPPSTSA